MVATGIEVDKAKVDVISKLPHPTTVKGIRSFLGHAGFYRRFIKDFSKISRPMTHLLEKNTPFIFLEDCILAFQTLKKKLTEASILIAPNWDQPFEIMCDASDYAIREDKELRFQDKRKNLQSLVISLAFQLPVKDFSGKLKSRWSGLYQFSEVYHYMSTASCLMQSSNFNRGFESEACDSGFFQQFFETSRGPVDVFRLQLELLSHPLCEIRYGSVKNHKKAVKNGQARTRESEEYKAEARKIKPQPSPVTVVKQSQTQEDKT
ncbi:reverse transcriptase domain-containing protein [Tanacetum coccineum]